MTVKRSSLVSKILKYIEQRTEWDKDTPIDLIIKSEVTKWGRYSATNRYNNNLVAEITTLYKAKHGGLS